MIETIEAVLITMAVMAFITLHTRHYDWWKSGLGLTMNGSLMSVVVVAIGAAIPGRGGDIVTGIGFGVFLTLLAVRALVLDAYATQHEKETEHVDN